MNKLDKLYFNALKGAAKKARSEGGGDDKSRPHSMKHHFEASANPDRPRGTFGQMCRHCGEGIYHHSHGAPEAAPSRRIPSEKRWGVLQAASEKISKRAWPIQDTYDKEIIDAMAKLAWAMFWANREEEKGRSHGGQEIYDIVPQTPPAARKWARDVARKMLTQNKAPSLTHLYNVAVNLGYPHDADRFGGDIAHQAIGSGINWRDDIPMKPVGHARIPRDAIVVPHDEFYL